MGARKIIEGLEQAVAHAKGDAGYCWGSFCNGVYYGLSTWPSYSYWIVPGTVRDVERCKIW